MEYASGRRQTPQNGGHPGHHVRGQITLDRGLARNSNRVTMQDRNPKLSDPAAQMQKKEEHLAKHI